MLFIITILIKKCFTFILFCLEIRICDHVTYCAHIGCDRNIGPLNASGNGSWCNSKQSYDSNMGYHKSLFIKFENLV